MKRLYLTSVLSLGTLSIAEWIAIGTLFVGLVLAGGVLPWLRREQHLQETRLLSMRRTYQHVSTPLVKTVDNRKESLDRFYTAIAPADQVERSVGQLFELGARAGVALDKADYRLASDYDGRYRTYQIDLPVKASFTAVLAFCQQTLATLPFASLDAIRFRRDKVSNGQLEVTLRLTLFLSPPPVASPTQSTAPLTAERAG